MKQIILVAGVLFLFFQTKAQTKQGYTYYYELGLDAYKSKDYKKADSLFTRALELRPVEDAFFNRAICRFNQGDKAGYCEDMCQATDMGDEEAKKLFYKNCVAIQTLYLDSLKQLSLEKYWFTETKEIYNYKSYIDYKRTNRKGDVVEQYCIKNGDTIFNLEIENENIEIPQFPGGEQARLNFINKNVKYPVWSRDHDIQGTVYAAFVVNSEGTIGDIKIMRYPTGGGELVDETLRLLRLMPAWKPGTLNGKPVQVQFYMPMKFELRY
jgi:hypothetical protein